MKLTKMEEIMLTALKRIENHGIAVEEATQEELIEFIAEIKKITDDALIQIAYTLG